MNVVEMNSWLFEIFEWFAAIVAASSTNNTNGLHAYFISLFIFKLITYYAN